MVRVWHSLKIKSNGRIVAGVLLGIFAVCFSMWNAYARAGFETVVGFEFLRGGDGFDLNPHPQKMRVPSHT